MSDLDDIFGAGGPLGRALPGFSARPQQLRMARRVAAALEHRETLVVEAGTGTGKTFAYLVPALLSGQRVIVSTGTRTLQDQLFAKDLPLVCAALGRPARVSLLKGRANYLCRHRLELAGVQLALEGVRRRDPWMARIERWARTTPSGDLAEVPGLSDTHPLWGQVTSTRDNCLGSRCGELARCHVALARRRAQEADLIVVNHHLLLADLALKEDGFGDILGAADALILDEAHQLPDLAAQFFGANVGSRRIEHLLAALRTECIVAARGGAESSTRAAEAAAHAIEHALRELGTQLHAARGPRIDLTGASVAGRIAELAHCLEALEAELEAFPETAPLHQFAARAAELSAALNRIAAVDDVEGARSVELSARGFVLHLMPFDIAERFRALIEARSSAWIFTSATLSVGEDFSHFTERLGIGQAAAVQIASPFDYERQSLLYLPQGLPEPSAAGHVEAVLATAEPLLHASGGGAFVLFTSHRALSQAAALLRARWGAEPPFRLYVQGEAPREQLLRQFREDGDGVLLGTASFWEGVDVKGHALRLVIIEKLPFASPEDTLVRARIEHIESRGGNAFRDYQLPEAALALKQGVGRLIRSEEDYGAVVLCDRRVTTRAYGRVFLAALPPMHLTCDAEEARRFLHRHAALLPERRRAGVLES
jgi:ATP-dependent DNA helicase DinG